MDLFYISVQYIKRLCLGVLRVLSLKLICILGLKGILLLYIWGLDVFGVLLELFLMFSTPIFFYIFANGTVWSSSTLFCLWWGCWPGGWLLLSLELNLYWQFRILGSNGVVGRGNQPIFPLLKEVPRHFSCLGPRNTSANWDAF